MNHLNIEELSFSELDQLEGDVHKLILQRKFAAQDAFSFLAKKLYDNNGIDDPILANHPDYGDDKWSIYPPGASLKSAVWVGDPARRTDNPRIRIVVSAGHVAVDFDATTFSIQSDYNTQVIARDWHKEIVYATGVIKRFPDSETIVFEVEIPSEDDQVASGRWQPKIEKIDREWIDGCLDLFRQVIGNYDLLMETYRDVLDNRYP